MNLDLDEIESFLDYLEEWKKLIRELRAARAVVVDAEILLSTLYDDDLEIPGMTELCEALNKYDEVAGDEDGSPK